MAQPMSAAASLPTRPAAAAEQARGLWWFIIVITGTTSLALNVTHAVVYRPAETDGMVELSDAGRVILAIVASVLPVLMAGLLSHTFVVDAPWPIKTIVGVLFVLGMGMSLSAQVELLTPVVGDMRAMGTAAVIDVPALIALIMIERGNRAQKAAEQSAVERSAAERRAAERERRERLAAEQRAADQAAAERLAAEQRAVEEAATARAEIERRAAAERLAAERQAAQRAESERLAAAERAAAERLAAERARAEQAAAEQAADAERARAERLAAAERLATEQRATDRERSAREAAERQAEADRKEAERQARAEAREARQARAEQAQRGDLSADEKRAIIRAAYTRDPDIKAPAAAAEVEAKGGQISEQRARAVLADLRRERGGVLADVRQLRSPAAV